MRHAAFFLLIASLAPWPRAARAQTAQTDSTFLTGACPTRLADSVKWDAVVTTPEQPARIISQSLPLFPVHLRRDGYNARVVVGMVIDTLGNVVPGTVSITASTDSKLSACACTIAFQLKFTPARVANKPVNALSEQPLSYSATVRGLPARDYRSP